MAGLRFVDEIGLRSAGLEPYTRCSWVSDDLLSSLFHRHDRGAIRGRCVREQALEILGPRCPVALDQLLGAPDLISNDRVAMRRDQQYCSATCRVAAHRRARQVRRG